MGKIEVQRERNLDYLLRRITESTDQVIERSVFTQLSAKIDKDYHAMIGLSRRVELPAELQVD